VRTCRYAESVELVVADRSMVFYACANIMVNVEGGIVVARMIADAAFGAISSCVYAAAETVAGAVLDAIDAPLSCIEARKLVVTRVVADHAAAWRRFKDRAFVVNAHKALLPHEVACTMPVAGVVADHAATHQCTDRHARTTIVAGVVADPAAAPVWACAGSRRKAGRVADIDIAGVVADDAVTFRGYKRAGEWTIAGVIANDGATSDLSKMAACFFSVTGAIADSRSVAEGRTCTFDLARVMPDYDPVARGVEVTVRIRHGRAPTR